MHCPAPSLERCENKASSVYLLSFFHRPMTKHKHIAVHPQIFKGSLKVSKATHPPLSRFGKYHPKNNSPNAKMVTIDGNHITIGFGIIAAILIVSALIAFYIKAYKHHSQNREEEDRLNAETDNTSIEIPARGFSLLRALNGRDKASHPPQPDTQTPSRTASVLRSLSRVGRWHSKRNPTPPRKDLENQITEYRGPSAKDIPEEPSTSGVPTQQPFPYQSRGQMWRNTQPELDTPRTTTETPGDGYFSLVPRASGDIAGFLDPEIHYTGDVGCAEQVPWEEGVGSVSEPQYRAFRGRA